MELSTKVVFVKNRSKEEIAQMEQEFSYCQERLDDPTCWQRLYELFYEALRITVTKKTKQTGVLLADTWLDRISDGTYEYMKRYEKDPSYRSPYLFKAANWMSLKVLYDKHFRDKYEPKEVDYEKVENIVYNSFEDDLIEKLTKEGY